MERIGKRHRFIVEIASLFYSLSVSIIDVTHVLQRRFHWQTLKGAQNANPLLLVSCLHASLRMSVTAVKKFFYILIHWILHSLFSLKATFFKWERRLRRKLNGNGDASFDKSLFKTPNHVAIITNCSPNDIDRVIINVSHLIYWASLLDLQYISVYDVRGLLIQNKKLIEERIKKVQSSAKENDYVALKNGYKEPYFTLHNKKNLSKVIFLSCADGKHQLVNIAKQFATKISSISNDPSEKVVFPGDVSKILRTKQDFPDPDLAIILGETPCVFGYPPWQLRLTEIVNIHSFDKIELEDFIEVMNRYSKCQQRFGK